MAAAAVVVATAAGGVSDWRFYLGTPVAVIAVRAHVHDFIIPIAKFLKTRDQAQTDVAVYLAALGAACAFACVRSQYVLWVVQAFAALGLAF